MGDFERNFDKVAENLWNNYAEGRILRTMGDTIDFLWLAHQTTAGFIDASMIPGPVKVAAHLANFTGAGLTEGIFPLATGFAAGLVKLRLGIRSGIAGLSRRS